MTINRISKGQVAAGGGINTGGIAVRSLRAPISTATFGVERDTGLDLPVGAVVKNVYVQVTTREITATTKTISVGILSSELAGGTNAFLAAVTTASAGLWTGIQGNSATSGAFGSLLTEVSTVSALVRRNHIVRGAAQSLAYTLNSAHTELVGTIVVEFDQYI